MNDLESLMSDLDQNAHKVGDSTFLFLDLSSTATGYSVFSINFKDKKASALSAGVIWFNDSWSDQEKYHYLYEAVTSYFNIIHKIDYCISEQYMVNPRRMSGCQVSIEMKGALLVSLAEIGLKHTSILPQSWRKELGIKAIKNEEGKKDYKTPTKDKIETFTKLPKKLVSNITGNERNTPSDLADSLGVALGSLTKFGIRHFNFSDIKFQEHAGALSDKGNIQ